MTFSLATISHQSKPTPVIETDGVHYRLDVVAPELLARNPQRGLMNIFESWETSEARLLELVPRLSRSQEGALATPQPDDFLTPLQYPSKLLLGGANYYEHMRVDGKMPDFQKENMYPVFFLKPPSTSLVGCGKTVRYPIQSKCFDWEIELAVVVGRRMRRVSPQEAVAGVAGYTVGLDLSARDWQLSTRHPYKFDLFAGKAFDDSCPLGPKIVPARFVDPANMRLQLRVNGKLRQNALGSDMIWSVGEHLSLISETLTLEPGDVLLTGTPAGVGLTTETYLKVGDKIDAEITGLGNLHVEIIPDTGSIQP